MENKLQFVERLSGVIVGIALIMISFFLAILGLTLLPVIGILLAIPLMSISLYFMIPEVRIHTEEVGTEAACEEHETWCPWPPVYYDRNAV